MSTHPMVVVLLKLIKWCKAVNGDWSGCGHCWLGVMTGFSLLCFSPWYYWWVLSELHDATASTGKLVSYLPNENSLENLARWVAEFCGTRYDGERFLALVDFLWHWWYDVGNFVSSWINEFCSYLTPTWSHQNQRRAAAVAISLVRESDRCRAAPRVFHSGVLCYHCAAIVRFATN